MCWCWRETNVMHVNYGKKTCLMAPAKRTRKKAKYRIKKLRKSHRTQPSIAIVNLYAEQHKTQFIVIDFNCCLFCRHIHFVSIATFLTHNNMQRTASEMRRENRTVNMCKREHNKSKRSDTTNRKVLHNNSTSVSVKILKMIFCSRLSHS